MEVERKFVKNFLTKAQYTNAVAVSVLVLFLCTIASIVYWNSLNSFSGLLAASHDLVVVKREIWRLFTTSFVHGDVSHLLSNSLMLYILMYFVTSFYGAFISSIVSFLVAMLTNYIVLINYGGDTTLVGASGVVYYLWGFWMVLYIFIQRHYSIGHRLLRMGGVFMILLIPSEFQANTSYLAHGVGFGLGFATGLIFYLFKKDKLHQAETWESRFVNRDELSELDEIALSYPQED